MKPVTLFAVCLAACAVASVAQAEPLPSGATGFYPGIGKAKSFTISPYKFNVTFFLQIKDDSMADLIFVRDGQTPSATIPGEYVFVEPNLLFLKFPSGSTESLSGGFILKGKPGKFSLKGTMHTLTGGYIGSTLIASKFKQSPEI